MKYFLNAGIAFISLVSVGALSGCNLYEPGTIIENKIQVREEAFIQDVALSSVDEAFVAGLARHYIKHGGSTMDLVVTYDPTSRKVTAMSATSKASDVVVALRDRGVTNVKAGIMPIKSQGDDARLLISYDAFTAHAPEGCEQMMPGMDTRHVEGDNDYKLGCSLQSLVARQVAKPSDLLGRGASGENTDGRSASNIVELYRTGAQNDPLEGEVSSE